MYYIEMGMGPSFKWLAVLFAVFTAIASVGIGNMFTIILVLVYKCNQFLKIGDILLQALDCELAIGVRRDFC